MEDDYSLTRDELYERLKDHGIYTRRYFYPLISDFQMYRNCSSIDQESLLNARAAAKKVLCLPIYPSLLLQDVISIVDAIGSYS